MFDEHTEDSTQLFATAKGEAHLGSAHIEGEDHSLHLHPCHVRAHHYQPGDFPKTADAFARCMSLPIYPTLADNGVERIVRTIEQVVSTYRRTVMVVA